MASNLMRSYLTIIGRGFGGLLLAGLMACGGTEEPPSETMPAKGTSKLTFKLSDTVRTGVNPTGMKPLKGTVYGDLFLAEDVTVVGPLDEAVHYASIELPIDFTTMQVSSASWTSMELAPNRYNFLGFFDLGDETKPENRMPQSGDPVTLAVTNRFDIESSKQTEYTVTFDLLFN